MQLGIQPITWPGSRVQSSPKPACILWLQTRRLKQILLSFQTTSLLLHLSPRWYFSWGETKGAAPELGCSAEARCRRCCPARVAARDHGGSGSSSPFLGVCKGGKQGTSHPRDTPRTGAGRILSEAWGVVSSQGSREESGFGGIVGGFLAIPVGAAEIQQRALPTAIDSALIKSKVSALSPGQPGPLQHWVLPATPFQHVIETFLCPRFTCSGGCSTQRTCPLPTSESALGN